MLVERTRKQQVEHLAVLPEQVGPNGRRKIGDAPKEVLVVRGGPGGAALLQALSDDLEHVVDVALDFDVDRAGDGAECRYD